MTNILSSVFPNSNSKNQPVENLPDLTFLSSVDLKLQPLDENFTSVILPLDRDVNLNVGDGKITQVDHIKVFQPLHEKISENLSHQDLTIKRWQSSNGRGQLGGKINLEITRNCVVKSEPINLKITELYPWCITPFYSTFTEQTKVKASNIFWQPGVINEKPNHINYQISIKCGQTYSNSLDYEAKILGWTKYPADAERGIFINPSIIEINQNPDQTLFASGLIIDVPKPDFSMPFNALCLACTAVAILFGNLHMILTKPVDVASEKNEKFISKVFKKIGALLKRKKD